MGPSFSPREKGSARSRPSVCRVGVRGVFYPGLPLPAQPRPQLGSPDIQHRAEQHQPPALRPRRGRGPVAQAAEGGALGPHQIAFGHVAGGVGEQDDAGAGLAGGFGDQAMTGGAGGGGQAGRRFRARPRQGAPVGAGGEGGLPGEIGPAGAVGVQAVVDGEGQQTAAVVAGPAGGDLQQGDGVAAAGEGEGQRPVRPGFEPRAQPFADAVRPCGAGRAQPALRAGQAKRVRSSPARVRRAALPPAA